MNLRQSVRRALSICAICFLLIGISSAEDTVRVQDSSIEPEGRALFNPRVDYDQWQPVGHADPLKNDPTFDYVPPTLGNVRYWSEHSDYKNRNKTSNSSEKNEILLLGVPVEHSVHLQSNHLSPPEGKAANRRSSPYYPPEPSRVLTPPPAQALDQHGYPSEYNYYAAQSAQHSKWSNDLPAPQPNDAYSEESASYVTVIRPKTNPHPYSSTIYNKNVRNSIYNLAANVNSLEPVDRKKHWIQSLLEKEAHQPQATTPQVVLAYSPLVSHVSHVYEPKPLSEPYPKDTVNMENGSFAEPTTSAPMALTTDSLFSHYNQPILPVRGPMYLIFQGHSKVKTYGPDSNGTNKAEKQDVKMVPVTMKENPVVKHVVSLDSNGSELQVKHLHKLHTPEPKTKASASKPSKKAPSAMDSLLSLLDSSLASFGMNDKELKNKPNDNKAKVSNKTNSTSSSKILGPTTLRPVDSDKP